MLSAQQIQNLADELQEKFRLLSPDLDQILNDLHLSRQELIRVLTMTRPKPEHVTQVSTYLDHQLADLGIQKSPAPENSIRINRWYR